MPGRLALLHAGPQAAAAAPPFSPLDIAGCRGWYKADAGTFTSDAMTTPATANNTPVGGWQDQSGNAKHLLHITPARWPKLMLAIKNGLPALLWDGVDDFFSAATDIVLPSTVFTAFYVHQTAGDHIWASGRVGFNYQLRVGQGGGNTLSLYDQTNNPISAGGAPARTTWTQAAYTVNAPTPLFYVNGVNYATGGAVADMRVMSVGGDHGGNVALINGYVGEIIFYNTLLTAPERAQVESYLQARWAL